MNTATINDIFTLTNLEETIKDTGELAIRAAERSREFRQDFGAIASWWASVHAQPERLLAILYVRLQENAGASRGNGGNDLARQANRARAFLRSLNRTDVSEAIAGIESRIAASPVLARRLAAAQDELAEMRQDLEAIARRLVPQLRESGVTRAEATADVGDGEVEALAWGCYLNGVRISCWLAVAVVLIAILLL